MNPILISVIILGSVGALAALALYAVSRRFAVSEDPRILEVEDVLPGANCGACGCNGCHDFAVKCVGQGGVDGLNCPGAGAEGMKRIAAVFGVEAAASVRNVAVLRCAGACASRREAAIYQGPLSCAIVSSVSAGPESCAYGCLGCGDCVGSCRFGAMTLNPDTRLPEIDQDACTGCGVCVDTCPRNLLQLRPYGPKGRRVWVSCSSLAPGAVARRNCSAACIGCGKCARTCPFGAITVENNLAVIDASKCRLCRKCVAVCPTGAIHTANFPVILPSSQSDSSHTASQL